MPYTMSVITAGPEVQGGLTYSRDKDWKNLTQPDRMIALNVLFTPRPKSSDKYILNQGAFYLDSAEQAEVRKTVIGKDALNNFDSLTGENRQLLLLPPDGDDLDRNTTHAPYLASIDKRGNIDRAFAFSPVVGSDPQVSNLREIDLDGVALRDWLMNIPLPVTE